MKIINKTKEIQSQIIEAFEARHATKVFDQEKYKT